MPDIVTFGEIMLRVFTFPVPCVAAITGHAIAGGAFLAFACDERYMADGPFKLMEPSLIPKLDNGRGSVAYRWRDTSAVKGRTYWYYITVIYSSGDRRPLSVPHQTLAK